MLQSPALWRHSVRWGLRWSVRQNISPCGDSRPGSETDCVTMPNHATLKASTLRTILTQAGISREEFLRAYERA